MKTLYSAFSAALEMISVAQEGTVFRGKSANKYIGMDSDGNLLTYVSIYKPLFFQPYLSLCAFKLLPNVLNIIRD